MRKSMQEVYNYLSDKQNYLHLIEQYIATHDVEKKEGRSYLRYLEANRTKLASDLSKKIQNCSFSFSYSLQERLQQHDKKKFMYTYIIPDLIMQKAMLTVLERVCSSHLSTNLYSYLKGRNHKQAIANLVSYIKKKDTNLWVYKTDIKKYFESICIHKSSELWKILDEISKINVCTENQRSSFIKKLYYDAARPTVITLDRKLVSNSIGIPYGSPLSGLFSNLYLSELDNKLSSIPGIFYSRYSDDMLIVSDKRQDIITCIQVIEYYLKKLNLEMNPCKVEYIYFTKSGRSSDQDSIFKGTSAFTYIGYVIKANGMTQPSRKRTSYFLTNCKSTIQYYSNISKSMSRKDQLRIICKGLSNINLSFNGEKKELVKDILFRTTDKNFLKQLDLQIAVWIAETLTGIKGVKAFRELPYRTIRESGLPSLEKSVNVIYKLIKKNS